MGLHINNLIKNYGSHDQNEQIVLDGFNLEVKDGEFVCLLGASGCGKSTLLNMVAGLDVVTSGQILLDGKNITKPGPDRIYIFQEHALFPWLNVIENVKFGMKMNKVSKAEQERRALETLQLVNLEEYAHYRVHELSGGMKQRVALARALCLDSRILLMDEPFAALDSHTREQMQAHLLEIWKKTGKTILFVTHNISEAFDLATRVLVLNGRPAQIVEEFKGGQGRPRQETLEMMTTARTALGLAS